MRALTLQPRRSGHQKATCEVCIHAVARAICLVCYKRLCKKHTVTQNGQTTCREHKQGWNV